jgi:N-hydroxyarylamine O-acetyltransferase
MATTATTATTATPAVTAGARWGAATRECHIPKASPSVTGVRSLEYCDHGPMDDETVDRYLARIGRGRPGGATEVALRDLHSAHLLAVPFENLSIHLGEPIILEEDALVDKLIRRNRGGFCYELNGAFALLLVALGFEVSLLSARVFGPEGPGAPFDHLVLRVDTGGRWFVDVGFGDHSRYPLALDDRGPQEDPAGLFQVVDAAEGDVDVTKDGVPQYRVEGRPRRWADFVPTCWWHQSSPRSHFTQSLVCSRALPAGRVTLSDRRLIRSDGGVRSEQVLTTDEEVLAAYRDNFGIVLPAGPPHLDRR